MPLDPVGAPDRQAAERHRQRPPPVEAAGGGDPFDRRRQAEQRRDRRAEGVEHEERRRRDVVQRERAFGLVPPAGVPEQPEDDRHDDGVGAAAPVAFVAAQARCRRAGRRRERHPDAGEEHRPQQPGAGEPVADLVAPVERDQHPEPAGERAEEGDRGEPEEVFEGGAHEDHRQGHQQRRPLAEPPPDPDEEEPVAEQEHRGRGDAEGHHRAHAEARRAAASRRRPRRPPGARWPARRRRRR